MPKTKRLEIRIDKKLKDEYAEYCKRNNVDISSQVRNFIRLQLNKNGDK